MVNILIRISEWDYLVGFEEKKYRIGRFVFVWVGRSRWGVKQMEKVVSWRKSG